MNNIWNNTCVLISDNGEVVLSDPLLRGHNEAISYCAKKVKIDISTEQSMPSMLQILNLNNHTVLLNGGRVLTESGVEKRTGYLALPSSFSLEQISQIENLKIILDDYQAVTVWKLENNNLKTKSMGDSKLAVLLVQNMIDEVIDKNQNNIKK